MGGRASVTGSVARLCELDCGTYACADALDCAG